MIQPCDSPKCTSNQSVICQFNRILHFTFLYMHFIVVNHSPEMPVKSDFDHNYALLMLSYAFFEINKPDKC